MVAPVVDELVDVVMVFGFGLSVKFAAVTVEPVVAESAGAPTPMTGATLVCEVPQAVSAEKPWDTMGPLIVA